MTDEAARVAASRFLAGPSLVLRFCPHRQLEMHPVTLGIKGVCSLLNSRIKIGYRQIQNRPLRVKTG